VARSAEAVEQRGISAAKLDGSLERCAGGGKIARPVLDDAKVEKEVEAVRRILANILENPPRDRKIAEQEQIISRLQRKLDAAFG